MNTTKTGLKLSLFAAILYFGALQSPLIPILMLGFLLLTEPAEHVGKLVSQALTILGLVWLIGGGYDLISLFVNFLNSIVGSGYLHMPYALTTFVSLLMDGVLFVFGVLALMGRYAGVSPAMLEKAVHAVQQNAKLPNTDKGDTKQ